MSLRNGGVELHLPLGDCKHAQGELVVHVSLTEDFAHLQMPEPPPFPDEPYGLQELTSYPIDNRPDTPLGAGDGPQTPPPFGANGPQTPPPEETSASNAQTVENSDAARTPSPEKV